MSGCLSVRQKTKTQIVIVLLFLLLLFCRKALTTTLVTKNHIAAAITLVHKSSAVEFVNPDPLGITRRDRFVVYVTTATALDIL